MTRKKIQRRGVPGQGLVEYALLLVLVAVVVMGIAYIMGLGVERIYALVAGALGASKNTNTSSTDLGVSWARCVAYTGVGTGLVAGGSLPGNLHAGDVTASTDKGGPIDTLVGIGQPGTFQMELTGGWGYSSPIYTTNLDFSVCPKTFVIQGKDGTVAIATVQDVKQP